ncbi:MAG: alpha/beta hydrolase [Bacteroidetes bacterium]|nr:alpha/beta hydrolase [Bacteroidota bacterium]
MKRFLKISFIFIIFSFFLYSSCSTSKFFYYPDKEVIYSPDTFKCRYEEVNFKAPDENTLNGWFIKPKSDTVKIIATILFLHGNGGNIGYQFAPLALLAQNGFQGLVFDYVGYGKSEGKPSQEKVLNDAMRAVDYMVGRKDVTNTKLILFGQSLGGHLACVVAGKLHEQYAGKIPIDALVIEGAFTGHEEIAAYHGKKSYFAPGFLTRALVPSKYDAIEYIGKIPEPKLVIHSTEDKVCPFFMGKELFEKAIDPKEFWEIKGSHIAACRLYPNEFVKKFTEIISTRK